MTSNVLEGEIYTSILGDKAPVASAMLGNVGRELVVFFRSPLSSLNIFLLTAWNSTHFSFPFLIPFCLYFLFLTKSKTITKRKKSQRTEMGRQRTVNC